MNKRPHPRSEDLKLKSVSPLLVDKIIKNLNNSKSSGLDNVDTYIIKLIIPYMDFEDSPFNVADTVLFTASPTNSYTVLAILANIGQDALGHTKNNGNLFIFLFQFLIYLSPTQGSATH